jgi:hypothetical protein
MRMRLKFTLVIPFLLLIHLAFGRKDSIPSSATSLFSCRVGIARTPEPIVIIDGVVQKFFELSHLNPNQILSITILKYPNTPLPTHNDRSPVISIVTKEGEKTSFIIKDKESGKVLPDATVKLLSGQDTSTFLADNEGRVRMPQLKFVNDMNLLVSHVGYKTREMFLRNITTEILMEKDIQLCLPVIVLQFIHLKRRMIYGETSRIPDCRIDTITNFNKLETARTDKKELTGLLYPNPVQKGDFFHLQFTGKQDEALTVNLYSLNGSLLLSRPIRIMKGNSTQNIRVDQRLATGLYIVHLQNAAGTILMNEKLMIQ